MTLFILSKLPSSIGIVSIKPGLSPVKIQVLFTPTLPSLQALKSSSCVYDFNSVIYQSRLEVVFMEPSDIKDALYDL